MTGEKAELSSPAPRPITSAAPIAAGSTVVFANAISATPAMISASQKIWADGIRFDIGPASSEPATAPTPTLPTTVPSRPALACRSCWTKKTASSTVPAPAAGRASASPVLLPGRTLFLAGTYRDRVPGSR
jgi:hypothetical protein